MTNRKELRQQLGSLPKVSALDFAAPKFGDLDFAAPKFGDQNLVLQEKEWESSSESKFTFSMSKKSKFSELSQNRLSTP